MKLTLKQLIRSGETRGFPNYLFRGRMRASTAVLILAFIALFWVYENYQPTPAATSPEQTQVIPPGFVPDPNYTWVPRTNVQSRTTESTTTTTTATTTTTPPPTTTTTEEAPPPTNPFLPGPPGPLSPSTTVIDPDGPGPMSPQTFTEAPPAVPPSTVTAPGSAPTTSVPLQ